jgi:hypothetical protein
MMPLQLPSSTEVPVLEDLIGPAQEEKPPEAPAEPAPVPPTEAPAAEPTALPEEVIAAEVASSPVMEAPPIHAAITIRGWFHDTFNNLIATGRVRERDAEAYLQDLLHRLGF